MMKHNTRPRNPTGELLQFSDRERVVAFTMAFLASLVPYVMALAPTVTFEDSGELITAAYTLGIPHEPGYPLFTLIGKIFSLLPLGDVAFRVNLASAVFSALGAAFIPMVVFDLSGLLFGRDLSGRKPLIHTMVLCAAVTVALGRSYLSQALITEVYGLNNFFTGFLLWLLIRWYVMTVSADGDETLIRRERYFYLYCFLAGLAMTNHHTSAVFVLLGLVFAFLIDRSYLLEGRRVLAGFVFLCLGLLPYIYLPLASVRDPVMDWGNPENWTNFWRVVGRHQYGLDIGTTRSLKVLVSQVGLHYELLFEQFSLPFLAAGLLGLAVLWRQRRKLFFTVLMFNFLTGPLVAYVTNVNITGRDLLAIAEQRGLVSVMYLPFYICWGILTGVGLIVLLQWVVRRTSSRPALIGMTMAVIVGTGWLGWRGYGSENMANYRFTRQFCENLDRQLEPNSVVIANWDPFAFPVMYFQHVEGRAPGMIFLDVELLRRSWYIQMLRRWYPEFMSDCQTEVDAFLAAVRPFEDGKSFDPNFIQQRYLSMIHAMIDKHIDRRPVYITVFQPIRPLEPGMTGKYSVESYFVAQRLRRAPFDPTPIDDRSLDLEDLTNPDLPKDRMANMLRNYYAIRFAERAALMENRDRSTALRLYRRSLDLVESLPIRRSIQQRFDIVSVAGDSAQPHVP